MYTVQISRRANKIHSKISAPYKENITKAIEDLIVNPFPLGCKKIKGIHEDIFRIREGPYRIIYEIYEKAHHISVIYIDHRKDVYKKV